MFIPEIDVSWRINQSFKILINNFFKLFLPIFIYNLISFVFIWTILIIIFSSLLSKISLDTFDFFSFLNNSSTVLIIVIWTIFFIIYLLLYIPLLISLIKSIKQAYLEEKITVKENLIYWFLKLKASLNIYWYIFTYVALLPSLLFIIWWILFNVWFYFKWQEFFKNIGLYLMLISVLIFVFFLIYRWLKTKFSINSAIENDDYSKKNFKNSVKITDNNWWRIIWNIFVAWLLISIISWIIWIIFSLFIPSWINISKILTQIFDDTQKWNVFNINSFKDISNSFSLSWHLISSFFKNIISTISSVFFIIFYYIFYKRLEFEYLNNEKIDNEKIDNELNKGIYSNKIEL